MEHSQAHSHTERQLGVSSPADLYVFIPGKETLGDLNSTQKGRSSISDPNTVIKLSVKKITKICSNIFKSALTYMPMSKQF